MQVFPYFMRVSECFRRLSHALDFRFMIGYTVLIENKQLKKGDKNERIL